MAGGGQGGVLGAARRRPPGAGGALRFGGAMPPGPMILVLAVCGAWWGRWIWLIRRRRRWERVNRVNLDGLAKGLAKRLADKVTDGL